jgi:ABC-2 type transporter.
VLREILALALMFIKEAKAWVLVNIFFLIMFPIAMIFSFRYIIAGDMLYYLISGTITFQIAITGFVAVPQTIGMDRDRGRLSLMIASGVPAWAYAMTSTLVNNIMAIASGFLIIGIAMLISSLGIRLISIALLLVALIVGTFQGSMIGLALAAKIRNWRLLNQVSQLLGFGLTFFAPVYFPLSVVPKYLLPLAMLEPTTYIAQAVRLSLTGSYISLPWDAATLVYGVVFAILVDRWGLG